ncbi:hypothetical protein BDV96DRAFT_670532 [Lophiotrema nucula]|uniref:Uncharacterized protein n=1 Tax=Lophiotrema nucula TaxID=690887 RepID=A0A6A5YMT5_9PLEO|nr:hypothetical protein BDV96DRAFT_670532 [Lophiotrema nucula]
MGTLFRQNNPFHHLRVYLWGNLTEVANFELDCPSLRAFLSDQGPSQVCETKIDTIFAASSSSHFLVSILTGAADNERRFTSTYSIPNLQSEHHVTGPLVSQNVPVEIQRLIEIPLGILPRNRLIFLDKDYWMCSYRFDGNISTEKVQRYYFLPKDWTNIEWLEQCALLGDGKFLIPNNGELAVVRCIDIGLW